MISATFLVLLAVFFIAWKVLTRKSNYPPGPIGLPILGNILQFGRRPHLVFTKWIKDYGKIFSIRMGLDDVIVINDHKLMKEIFNEPAFSGRPQNDLPLAVTDGSFGVINTEGEVWETQRRFTLRHLRDFGFGKNYMENSIMDEVKELLEHFKRDEGQPIVINRRFSLAVLNSLWTIIAGKRLAQDDPMLDNMLESLTETFNALFENGILIIAPWIKNIAPGFSGWNKLLEDLKPFKSYVKGTVDEHKKNISEGDPRDFVDNYLQVIKETEDPKSSFYKENGYNNLRALVGDLLQAGSETTSTTLNWVFLYLISHPEVQQKLHEEIDSVIGKSRLPTLSDRPQMPYIEAMIMEILRIATLTPLGVFHSALHDKEFHGYLIPKGTIIMANMYSVHYDKDIWGDPENFRPERFLSEDGKTVKKHEALIPFQVGKRQCLGEPLARDTLFLFIISIFQRFVVSPELANSKFDFEPEIGFIQAPKKFKVVMKDRWE